MKLNKTSTFREFIGAIHNATMIDAAKNGTDPMFQSSYALGALEHLAMEMAKASPAAMALLNDYIAQNQPAPSKGNTLLEAAFKPLDEVLHPATAATSSNLEAAKAALLHSQEAGSELLRPLRQRAGATCRSAANTEPHSEMGELTSSITVEVSPAAPLHSDAGKSTTSLLESGPAMTDPAPIAGKPDQSADGTTLHAPETPQASSPQGSEQAAEAAPSNSPSHGSSQSKTDSSPQPSQTTQAAS